MLDYPYIVFLLLFVAGRVALKRYFDRSSAQIKRKIETDEETGKKNPIYGFDWETTSSQARNYLDYRGES